MKKILYIIFSTLIVIPALAEDTGSSKITVNFVDNTGTPIKDTTVTLNGTKYKTNRNGAITLDNTIENENSIEIKIDGFETNSISQNISQDLSFIMTRCKSDSTKPECNCDPMPDNATKAHREYKEDTKQEVCIIDECNDGYTISPDQLSCIELTLSEEDSNKTPEEQQENAGTTQGTEKSTEPILSEEDSNKKIEELQENADAMKEKEQSDANKLLGAASIGAMGIGGMQALSALSEQRADEDAELDMSAYLATFRCDFGQGRNIQGGQTGIVLPGGNQLFSLYNEYKTLAADLKTRKEALGLTPGIESETILDKANTGLYDDIGSGRSDGAYTSLATALSNPNSADAAEWAAQREDTATQLQRGLITVGVGAAASIIGNLAINENKKAAQESSDEIIAKFEPLKTLENAIKALPNQEANAKCPEGSTGTHPDCECTNDKQIYNSNANSCDTCPGAKIAIDNKCQYPNGTVPGDNDTCTDTTATSQCDTTDPNIYVDQQTGKCTCINGYIPTEDGKNCECPASQGYTIDTNRNCIKKSITANIATAQQEQTAILPAKNLFDLNSSNLTQKAKSAITEFVSNVESDLSNNKAYCINVTGHTDKTGTDAINNPLSQKRAEAVKNALVNSGIPTGNIKASGVGSTACDKEGNQPECRKVEIEFTLSACSA